MKRGANIVGRMDDTTRRTVRWDGWDDRPTDRLREGGREGGREEMSLSRWLADSLARPPAAVRSPSSTQKSAGIPLASVAPLARPPDHDGEAKLDLTALFRRRRQ